VKRLIEAETGRWSLAEEGRTTYDNMGMALCIDMMSKQVEEVGDILVGKGGGTEELANASELRRCCIPLPTEGESKSEFMSPKIINDPSGFKVSRL